MPTLPDGEDVRCEGGKRNTSFSCTLEENTYREYIETVIKQTYIKNNLTKINRYNGVQQVINNIKRIMEE